MDFSLDWFLSIPGLLITGGVLLFLIAFILLIVTMLKGKKKTRVPMQRHLLMPVLLLQPLLQTLQ